ncbi:wax ester/triacylglycerol synthase domain-containing protein [Speluncibacter jeojiensis]|uniref:wax ester/triacylglycerol synthase domain-containing protein n=1 Tax=Speluncibacter jeojiensis TaxID=2710754 RepID=UPI00240F97F5|nr:wax ester/triacylglycerol synthase domain-containing protein [Rhodococcus sp. D2-41]
MLQSIGKIDRLQMTDAAHVYAENLVNIPNVVDVWLFDATVEDGESVDVQMVTDWLSSRIGCDPIFRRKLMRLPLDLDFPVWVDDRDFRVSDHITVDVAGESGWRPVEGAVAAALEMPIDLGRPPWRMQIVTGIHGVAGMPASMTAAVLTFHHSAGDGVRTVDLGKGLFADECPSSALSDQASRTAGWRLLSAAALKLPWALLRFMTGMAKGVVASRGVADAGRRGELQAPTQNWPATRFNGAYSGKATVGVVATDLNTVRAIGSAVDDATVNDAAMAAISLALGSYLEEIGERPDDTLGATVPMSWRNSDRNLDAANQFSLMSVDLHTDISDPRERLRRIHASAQSEKRRQRHEKVVRLGQIADSVPAFMVRLAGKAAARRQPGKTVALGNTMISNVPRGNPDLQFCGAPLVDAFGVLAIGDMEMLNHFVSSVDDRLTVAFSVDREVMPDTRRYAELLSQAFDDLAEAVGATI